MEPRRTLAPTAAAEPFLTHTAPLSAKAGMPGLQRACRIYRRSCGLSGFAGALRLSGLPAPLGPCHVAILLPSTALVLGGELAQTFARLFIVAGGGEAAASTGLCSHAGGIVGQSCFLAFPEPYVCSPVPAF